MSPFDINPDNDAGHTIDQDDLIAFHLHELTPPQERALHRVLRASPDLQAESIAIASTLRAFPKHEPSLPLDTAALDRNWLALRNSLPTLVPAAIPTRSLFPRWAFPALAASALATTAVILTLHHTPPHAAVATTTHSAASPSNSIPSILSVPPVYAIPAVDSVRIRTSVSPASISHPSLDHATPHPRPTSASNPPGPLPATSPFTNAQPPQPDTSSPSAEAPTNTTIATIQQATPLTPTFTPLIQNRSHAQIRHEHTTDITVAAIGNLTPDRSFTSSDATTTAHYTQETTPSVGALASFHQQLRPWLGYRITGSYSEPTFEYVYQAGAGDSEGNIVRQHAYEFSGTYVVQGPRHRRIFTAAEVGTGLLAFLPADPNLTALPVVRSLRPEGVFGVSAEFALTRHLAIHAGYRALLYKAPTAYAPFGIAVPPAPNNLTLSNQPVIGLTYRFHPTNDTKE
jgi:hypothetical protein